MVQPNGLRAVKGVHSLGCAGCGEDSWWIGTVVGVEPVFWVAKCGEWTPKRSKHPFGLIASTWGWPVVDIWNSSAYGWEEHPFT